MRITAYVCPDTVTTAGSAFNSCLPVTPTGTPAAFSTWASGGTTAIDAGDGRGTAPLQSRATPFPVLTRCSDSYWSERSTSAIGICEYTVATSRPPSHRGTVTCTWSPTADAMAAARAARSVFSSLPPHSNGCTTNTSRVSNGVNSTRTTPLVGASGSASFVTNQPSS